MNGNKTSDMMWSVAPKKEPGTLLCEIPTERQYLTIYRKEYINALKTTIIDQLGRFIDLNGENNKYVLNLKRINKIIR